MPGTPNAKRVVILEEAAAGLWAAKVHRIVCVSYGFAQDHVQNVSGEHAKIRMVFLLREPAARKTGCGHRPPWPALALFYLLG